MQGCRVLHRVAGRSVVRTWRRSCGVRVAAGKRGRCEEEEWSGACAYDGSGNEEGSGWMRWNGQERATVNDEEDNLCETAAATTASVVVAGAVVAFGLGGDMVAHAHGLDAINEVTSVAEGEDFWTNVLRYITFFITIVTGFITFAVKYVRCACLR